MTMVVERNADEMPDVHIDQEPEFVPAMTQRQKKEHIGLLARALYPPKIAALITWWVSSNPKQVNVIFDEVSKDAASQHIRVTTDEHSFLIAKKFTENHG